MLKQLDPKPLGAILDMDGVLWKSETPLCNIKLIFHKFNENSIHFILATNNGTQTTDEFIEKIQRMGADIEPWQIVTSGMALGHLLINKFPQGGGIHILGSPALKTTLEEYGFFHSENAPLAIVAGMDTEISYQKIAVAANLARSGLPLYGSNPDTTYPTPEGLLPGAGVFISAVEIASGKKAIIAGKPNPYLFETAIEKLNIKPSDTLVIGDRLETDILGGFRAGCKTALVLSGVTKKNDLLSWEPQPDLVLQSIMELFEQ